METVGWGEKQLVVAVRRLAVLSMLVLATVDDATVRASNVRTAVRARLLPRGRLDEA